MSLALQTKKRLAPEDEQKVQKFKADADERLNKIHGNWKNEAMEWKKKKEDAEDKAKNGDIPPSKKSKLHERAAAHRQKLKEAANGQEPQETGSGGTNDYSEAIRKDEAAKEEELKKQLFEDSEDMMSLGEERDLVSEVEEEWEAKEAANDRLSLTTSFVFLNHK